MSIMDAMTSCVTLILFIMTSGDADLFTDVAVDPSGDTKPSPLVSVKFGDCEEVILLLSWCERSGQVDGRSDGPENMEDNTPGHDDVIKWKHFPRNWPFVRGIHRSPVNSLHKGQWRGAFMCSLICVWINGWVNNRKAGDLRRYGAHYDVTVMAAVFRKTHSAIFMMTSSNGSFLPRYLPFVRGIHRSPVNSTHKGPVMRTWMFLWCGSTKAVKQTVKWLVTTWRSCDVIVMFEWCHLMTKMIRNHQ